MEKKSFSLVTVIICLVFMTLSAVSVLAEEVDGGGANPSSSSPSLSDSSSSDSSSSSSQSSSSDSSSDSSNSSSELTGSSQTSSSSSSSDTSSVDSSSEISSDIDENEPIEDEPDEEIVEENSSNTSSTTSEGGYTTSEGTGGGKTFISETASQIAAGNSSGDLDSIGSTEDDSTVPESDYEGTVKSGSGLFYKLMIIPIVIGVLSVAGLVYMNFFFGKPNDFLRDVFKVSRTKKGKKASVTRKKTSGARKRKSTKRK